MSIVLILFVGKRKLITRMFSGEREYFREVIIKSARKAVQTNISFFEFCQNNETLKN